MKKFFVSLMVLMVSIPVFAIQSLAYQEGYLTVSNSYLDIVDHLTDESPSRLDVDPILDGDVTTGYNLQPMNQSNDSLLITFDKAYDITSFKLNFTGEKVAIKYFDLSQTVLGSRTVDTTNKNTIITENYIDVKFIVIQNIDSVIKKISDFNINLSDDTPPGEVSNLQQFIFDDTQLGITYEVPNDEDFSHVNVYQNGTFVTEDSDGMVANSFFEYGDVIKVASVDTTGTESEGVSITLTEEVPEEPGEETTPTDNAFSATVDIGAGSLTISPISISSFASIELDGTNQTTTSTLSDFQVTDATGTGAGWHVTVSSTPFTEVGGLGLTLPSNSLTLEAPSSITPVDTTSPAPTVQSGAPWVIDSGSAVTILAAAEGDGIGSYDVNFDTDNLTLTVPSGVKVIDKVNYPDSPTPYEATVTFSAISGP